MGEEGEGCAGARVDSGVGRWGRFGVKQGHARARMLVSLLTKTKGRMHAGRGGRGGVAGCGVLALYMKNFQGRCATLCSLQLMKSCGVITMKPQPYTSATSDSSSQEYLRGGGERGWGSNT
eukprot:scaffold22166_cov56-Isochrysis_galbana.AAC.1